MVGEQDFLNLLALEVSRCNRYRDYFALCLLVPSAPEVAAHVLRFVRATDLVGTIDALIGILLINTGSEEALSVAERLRIHISGSAPAEASLGAAAVSLACFPGDGLTSTQLVERAKARLLLAVQAGGDRVVYSEGS
jgi:GGDEF domain-containing protein